MGRQGTEVWSDLARRCSRAMAEEKDWAAEFAREVKAATAVRLRRANRSARRAAEDVEGELYELNREIAALALGALRARTDRRGGGRRRARSRVAQTRSRVEDAVFGRF
ncbi:hypothetical protein [Nocardia wallacei]|uniref:hypothetical protein n=1 Tax=Nocardia wallacei TaxID=480035 RepID=UPI002455A39C|nr:hypothetical protein [Nocardia wallacei]